MRQQEKQAAAAARELLKAEAARKRKAAAATLRKGSAPVAVRTASAAAQMRKGAGGAAPAQMRKGAGGAATSPEVRAAGAGDFNNSGTSPTSFVDGSCFFNNSGSLFGGGGPSSMSQPWVPSQSSDPTTWDTNPTPHGGFTNLIHPHLSQNYHFTGGLSHFAPFKAPRSMESEEEMSTPPAAMEENEYVDVDSEDELPRTEKRILWSQEEDVRLMSSWLHNSTDPTIGADRKNEQYWNDVANTYNETTPSQRKRNAKQAKDRFHKINKWTDLFHSAWVKARSIYTSGHNDQMWIDKAHYFYIEDNKEQKLGRFVLLDVWYAVRNEAKWITYNKGLKEARKRKGSDKDKEGEDAVDIDLEEVGEQPRPMGQKRAKKLALEKNSKKNESDIEELDKFGKIQSEEHANRLKVLEVQQKLSSEKIEQAKLAHQAAKEQKAAAEVQREARKLEVEARMFETYNRLLSVDVSLMSDEEKVDHANTVKYLKKKLFADI